MNAGVDQKTDRRPTLSARAWGALSAAVVAVWVVFSWPLPLHMASGVPSSSQNIEAGSVRRMMPGDHLQLLYHYWLAGDMLAGRTPWFCNVYEFNTGNDAARFRLHPHYAPFSWLYAALAAPLPRAAAMNLTGVVSLWMTAAFTLLLARRYAPSEWIAGSAAMVSILLPYRWAQLLGGSPAGHAMAWIPLICLGVDIAVRDRRAVGGAAAGAGLLFASWGDSHVFFFGAAAAAGWTLVALAAGDGWPWRDRRAWLALGRAAAVGMLFLVPTLLWFWVKARDLAGTTAGVERTPAEVKLFSPGLRDFFRWRAGGLPGHIYVGVLAPAMLAAAGLASLARPPKAPVDRRRWRVFWLLAAGIGLCGLLAMGPRGPFEGVVWRAACRMAPPYRMVRQPAKIFCLWPTLIPIALAAGGAALGRRSEKRAARWAVTAAVVLMAAEYRAQVRATICLLDGHQGAYEAAATASGARPPRALVLPLWPGDYAGSSAYQHYASLYRIRLANGYSPAIRRDYVDTFFRRFRKFNHGDLDDAGLDELRAAGIDAILFHEDSSEKVSPCPAGYTLEVLRRHPRLKFLARDGRVWAFAIRPEPTGADAAAVPEPTCWAPSRRFEGERAGPRTWEITEASCSGGAFGALLHSTDSMDAPRVPARFHPDAAWWLRVRGQGEALAEWRWQNGVSSRAPLPVAANDWTWIRLSRPEPQRGDRVALRLRFGSGRIEIDAGLFLVGEPLRPTPGQTLRLPATCFFRAGHACEGPDGGLTAVRLEADRDPDDRVFYGPWRPLAPGRYRARLTGALPTPVAGGTVLGRLDIEQPRGGSAAWHAAADGSLPPLELEIEQTTDMPFLVGFRYSRAADLVLHSLELLRLE